MDKFELLKKYKELLDNGIIEEAEFEAKKKELLAQPDDIQIDSPEAAAEAPAQSAGVAPAQPAAEAPAQPAAEAPAQPAAEAPAQPAAEAPAQSAGKTSEPVQVAGETPSAPQQKPAAELSQEVPLPVQSGVRQMQAAAQPSQPASDPISEIFGTKPKETGAQAGAQEVPLPVQSGVRQMQTAAQPVHQVAQTSAQQTQTSSGISEEEKENIRKEGIYKAAMLKKGAMTVKTHKEAIADFDMLGDWKDSAEQAKKLREELPEVQEKEERERKETEENKALKKKKRKKILKISGIAAGGLIALIIIICIIGVAKTPDLSEYEGTKEETLHSMKYSVPKGWTREYESDAANIYSKKNNDEIIAVMEVKYAGESDLSGDAAYEEGEDVSENASELLTDGEWTYQKIEAGTSCFEVTVGAPEGEVDGVSQLLDDVAATFDTDGYKNPRKCIDVKVSYSGSTKAGVVINNDCDDIIATQTFDTGVAKGKLDNAEWIIKKPVKLKAGKTSKVTVKVADKYKKTLKIKCSTISKSQYISRCQYRDYKTQLRKDYYGKYIKITGAVLQDCGEGYYRISSNGDYEDVYMVLAKNSHLVEDDHVTCYGVTNGIYSYETVMGAEQKVPSMTAKYVDRQ